MENEGAVSVDVVWMVVELDIDGGVVANTTFLNSNVTLVLSGFGEDYEGVLGEGEVSTPGGKISWPFVAISILFISYALAAISVWRSGWRSEEDDGLRGPFCEAE